MKDSVDEVNLRGRIGSEKDEKKKKETEEKNGWRK